MFVQYHPLYNSLFYLAGTERSDVKPGQAFHILGDSFSEH